MIRINALLYVLTLMIAFSGECFAVATATNIPAPAGGQAKWVQMENPYLKLILDPQAGARGAVLIDKSTGKDWLFGHSSREGSGLFMDHFWEQNWPGEFLDATYQAEIMPTSDGSAQARFMVTATGKWGNTETKLLSGLKLTRTVTLLPDSPVVKVKVEINNPTPDNKIMGYWMQNVLWANGDKDNDLYLRPNSRSVSRIGYEWKTKTPILGFMESEFERAPTAGWTALVDEKEKKGIVFIMDYGSLMFLYNCLPMTTVEWQYIQAAIPPGKTWETEVTMVMPEKLEHLEFASNEALFNTKFNIKDDSLDITLQASRSAYPVSSVKFHSRVLKLGSRQEVALPDAEITDLTFTPKETIIRMPGAFTEQIALKVDASITLSDKTVKDVHFEVFFGGKLGFAGINRTIDLPPMYPLPAQPKAMTFLKPAKIERLSQEKPKVLLITGRNGKTWRADEALAAWPAEATASSVAEASSIAANLTYWPVDYNTLMKFDAIVMADVDISSLGVLGQEMLRDYLVNGGSLVVLGGIETLGNGSFVSSRIADLLPVMPMKPLEIRPLKVKTLTVSGEPKIQSLDGKGVAIAHLLAPQPKATVALKAGEAPILIVGEAGKGRIAVFGATVLGKPDNAFWTQETWPQQLAQIIRWAANR